MRPFRVALLQLEARRGLPSAEREEAAWEACAEARRLDADLALFPEMWSVGYELPARDEEAGSWASRAIPSRGSYLERYEKLARSLGLGIGITYLEEPRPGERYAKPYNSLALVGPRGERLLDYRKVHACDFGEERHCAPGSSFRACDFPHEGGKIRLGAMICFDREFPESARVLALKGAEIVLVPNACEMEANRSSQLAARAFENMMGIALANYARGDFGGRSQAYDGMAFDSKGGSRDMLILRAGEEEGVFIAEFDLEALRRYRRSEVWGGAYRKVAAYASLVGEPSDGGVEDFARKDRR